MEYKRILGLDYGSKTVGVAVSDPLGITAQGVEIIRREKPTKLRKTLARIEELVAEKEVEAIVLGYPKHLNNTEGDRCEKTVEFKEMLENRLHLPVILWDERLTTVVADRTMDELGVGNHKEFVDEIAAMLILQNYLDSLAKS
ncbi:MAG: Holliday junction resolvase RuvX [Lachnospiraceae bacterium]|nr:Holliday junction resolvase RuvX [Lachnospiraceae bacterium]